MPSKILVDNALLAEALRLGEHHTKEEVVHAALEAYVAKRRGPDAADDAWQEETTPVGGALEDEFEEDEETVPPV